MAADGEQQSRGPEGGPEDGRGVGADARRAARRLHPAPRPHAAAALLRQEVLGIPTLCGGLRERPQGSVEPEVGRLRALCSDDAETPRRV